MTGKLLVMNLQRLRKKLSLPVQKNYPTILLNGLMNPTRKLCKNSQCLSKDSNRVPA